MCVEKGAADIHLSRAEYGKPAKCFLYRQGALAALKESSTRSFPEQFTLLGVPIQQFGNAFRQLLRANARKMISSNSS